MSDPPAADFSALAVLNSLVLNPPKADFGMLNK